VLSIVALAGYWIVFFDLVKMPPNVLPEMTKYPRLTLIAVGMMASLISPFTEEAAFRGYFQVPLEREFRGVIAVVISSLLFSLAHFTQGLYWPKLLVYFLAGLVFGAIAFLTQSTWPAIPVHILADMSFFALVWPYDAARRLVRDVGPDAWFYIHVAQAIVFSVLAVFALLHLARAANRKRPEILATS
jgi:membrane protease YdiL (CAAX protease family)